VNIELVFDDWRHNGESVYQSEPELSCGSFHSGTTFYATIDLDVEDQMELASLLKLGYRPVFWVHPVED
jgi:hypothetical protein